MKRVLSGTIILLAAALTLTIGSCCGQGAKTTDTKSDTMAVLKFDQQQIPFHIGQVGHNDEGKTFVEVSGEFDMTKSPKMSGSAYTIITTIMQVSITVGGKTMEFSDIAAGEGGFSSTFDAEGVSGANFRNIRFAFDTDAMPEKIRVFNELTDVTFDGTTKRVIITNSK